MRTNPVNLRLTDADLEAIGEEEGWVPYAYDDADPKAVKTFITEENADLVKGTLTIGYGHTRTVKPGMRIDRAQGLSLLRSDVRDAESCVHRYVKVPLTQGEFAGMVDLFYNVGPGSLPSQKYPKGKDGIACLGKSGGGRPSTLLTLLNKCEPHDDNAYQAVAGCFTQWVMPGSVFEWGLTKRRIRTMLRFLGLPITRAVLSFPNAPVASALRYDLVQRCIALAKEEAADQAAMQPAPKPAPTVTIITSTPAAPAPVPVPEAKAGQPELTPPSPAPAGLPPQKPAASSGPLIDAAGPAAVEPKAAPSVTPPPPVKTVEAPKPKAPVVIAPKAIDPKTIPYGEVDPTQATNMSESRRVAGMVVVGLGSMTQILAAREIVSSSVGAVFYDMSRDPIIVALFIGGLFWVIGWATRKRGTQIVTKGMVEAKTVLK